MTADQVAEGARISHDGPVVRLVLARPAARNALHPVAVDLLADAVTAVDRDAGGARVVVIQAEGPHFCAGIDLQAVNDSNGRPRAGHVRRGLRHGANRLIQALWDCELPVVASVRGHAAGLGCHLALAADFVVASQTARFSEPFAARGFVPDSGGTFLLTRRIGLARAKELLLRGTPLDAESAERWGLVTQVVDDDRLEGATAELVAELAASATLAIGLTKRLLHDALDGGLAQAMEREATAEELAVRSDDFKEGLRAFRERREPRYEGR